MSHLNINQVRSEALFASTLQRSDSATVAEVSAAIRQAVRRYGRRGCAARMAQEFGDHPEIAVARMCWARQMVAELFMATPPHPDRLTLHRAATTFGIPAGHAGEVGHAAAAGRSAA